MPALTGTVSRDVTSLTVAVQVWLLAGAAALAWLPFLTGTLSRDEAGLLIVGRQWSPGSSLYGDYWVDRPPLLVALFQAVSLVGDDRAVRLLGAMASAASVLAAAALGRAIAPSTPRASVTLAAITAVTTATPLLGAGAVDAEFLAVPLVLAGSYAMVRALDHASARPALGFALLTGVLGAGAALVKQNFVDVFVFAIAALFLGVRQGTQDRRRTLALFGCVALGCALACLVVLWLARLRGSSLSGLWDAVVVFRGEASTVLAQSATSVTAQRLAILMVALVASALPFIVFSAFRPPPGQRPSTSLTRSASGRARSTKRVSRDLRFPAAMVLCWEVFGVVLGGSYWLHYLVGLVPGAVLLVGATLDRRAHLGRGFRVSIVLASVSTISALTFHVVHPEKVPEQAAIDYLRAHAASGDTAVVAFGAPNILQGAGLTSPYPYLWSLPVRVRDPQLHTFIGVLAGRNRPTWLVVSGRSLTTWGVDEDAALPYVERFYEHRAAAGDFQIYSLTERRE